MKSVRKLYDSDPVTGNIRHCCSVAVPWKTYPPFIRIPGKGTFDPTITEGQTRNFVLKEVRGCSAKVYVEEGCSVAWMLDEWPSQTWGEPFYYEYDIS